MSEMLRTRGSRVLILDSLPRFRSLSDSAIGFYTLLTSILVRFSICGITPDTAQSEQAFSDDGGKTWETNWVNKYTRLAP